MSQHPPTFRDTGILPEDLRPPVGTIRSFLSTGRIAGQYLGMGIVAALGLGLTVVFALTLPLPLNLLAGAATLTGFATFLYFATQHDYRWVELEGTILRARHLYTGRTIERSIEEIECLRTMVWPLKRIERMVVENLLGRVKGVWVHFHDQRTPLRILRADPAMTNAKELIEAILYRMTQIRDVDAEIVQVSGQPLVRNIHWKGQAPARPAGNPLRVVLVGLILMAMIFGPMLGYGAVQETERQTLLAVAPHEITLSSLIQNGPGTNRHVTLTAFRPGGYVFEAQYGSWTTVRVALFPARAQANEIKVVLLSTAVQDEAALRRLLQRGRVTGICSATPRSGWGMSIGPQLVKVNDGLPLASAWVVEDLGTPLSAAAVTAMLAGSILCFAAVFLLAAIFFWKAA